MQSKVGLDAALAALRRGGVIAYPTETFYALGADPRKRSALRRLRLLKGRQRSKPLLLLACSQRQALSLVRPPYPSCFTALIGRFWPGPLTLILPPRSSALATRLGRAGGLAVRVTSHPLARRLIRSYGYPITGTSANRAHLPPARRPAQARTALGSGLDAVLDGGACRGGKPSTVVDLTRTPAVILRAGAIPSRALRDAFKRGGAVPPRAALSKRSVKAP